MKIPSIFSKTPKHQSFTFAPRYYDQQKEEMEERERRIKQELKTDESKNKEEVYRSRIAGSLQAARKRSKVDGGNKNAMMIRLAVILFTVLFFMAYLTWGSDSFYILILVLPVYIYFKFKNNRSDNNQNKK